MNTETKDHMSKAFANIYSSQNKTLPTSVKHHKRQNDITSSVSAVISFASDMTLNLEQ